ncbi:tyrosine-protein phosphatase [Rhizobium sp. FY34]|uniref:tyrosine-protein phosphatase n=1 Tax=Rhizobium sp. FY34 TaxID=2562309 RepID=UPI0010C0DA4B|nr:tyrosine-protein phosphatase [Rhizobium sp. FY34]
MQIRIFAKRAALSALGLVLALGLYLGYLQLSGNFHEILPGKFYRSAQLSSEDLGRAIDTYHIKTVINLRGTNTGHSWYDDEVAVTQAHGAKHIDFGISALKELTPEKSMALVALMRDAEGPLLIHCRGGADRTGLASVMYLQQIAGVDEETAEWQLTPLYGHINLPFLGAYAMDDTWEQFEKLIGLPS